MAYANAQKNGSLYDRLQMDMLEAEIPLSSEGLPKKEIANHQATNIERPYNDLNEQIQINITDDVDDEAVYGRNRHRHKPRGR